MFTHFEPGKLLRVSVQPPSWQWLRCRFIVPERLWVFWEFITDVQGDFLGLAEVCVCAHTTGIDSFVIFSQLCHLHLEQLLIQEWLQGDPPFIFLLDKDVGHHSGAYCRVGHLPAQIHPHVCLREWALDENGLTQLYFQPYFWEDLQGPRHCEEKKLVQKKPHSQMYLNFSHTFTLTHLFKPRAGPRPPPH